MKINMNGLRTHLTNHLNTLGAELEELLKDESDFVKERIAECFDDVASEVGLLNCIFNKADNDFTDMSKNLTVIRLGDNIKR